MCLLLGVNNPGVRARSPMKVKVLAAQLWLTLLRPHMDCSLPGSSVHGILQTRILEWVAISFSGGPPAQGLNPRLSHCRQILYHLSY